MAKTPIEKLDSAIKKILEEYGDDIKKNVGEASVKVAKKGAAALRGASAATFGGSGNYASGWTQEKEEKRWSTTSTIYNKNAPGLAHLLENGHATVNGGRVAGRPHIAPVEKEIAKEFEEGVIGAINGY